LVLALIAVEFLVSMIILALQHFLSWCDNRVNEEMIETLFVSNSTRRSTKIGAKGANGNMCGQENKVLDPKKSQNIAIMLRALDVTKEEVCKALLDGEIIAIPRSVSISAVIEGAICLFSFTIISTCCEQGRPRASALSCWRHC
jgi:hypothetical protein